jgi:hypothetical protein
MTTEASPSTSKVPLRVWWWRPLAFLGGLAVLLAGLYAVGRSRYETVQFRSDRQNLDRLKDRNAVVFGSSHGFDILPEEVGLDGVNLAHGGQDAFEMAYMARVVKRRIPHLETVVFAVSYFTFALDNAAYIERGKQTRIGRRLAMYASFSSLGFVPGDGPAWVKGLLAPVVTKNHWKNVLWPWGSSEETPNGFDLPPSPKRDRGVTSRASAVAHAERRCDEYDELMQNMASNHPNLDEDAYSALRDVAKELEGSGVRVVLVTPPYYVTYNDCFDPKLQERTRRFAERIAGETGAEYFDASRRPEFTRDRRFFLNSDHMNRTGKIEFSRWLGRRLKLNPRGKASR